MITFEKMFSDVEAGADKTKKTAASFARKASQLQKAAQDGNIGAIKKISEQLGQSFNDLKQTVSDVSFACSFTDEEISSYMSEKYTDELRQEASKLGFDIFERDGALISYPSIIRLLPAQMALKIDRKKVTNIRPSKLAVTLLANKEKGATFKPAVFLEALYKVYEIIAKSENANSPLASHHSAPVVPLEAIYKMFTSLPGSHRDYEKMDFARDIYLLDTGEIKKTKAGATVSLPASTGLKSGKGIVSFVGPDGNTISYYGIQFSRGN